MQFKIFNRFSGEVQFTAEIDCSDNERERIKLGLAIKWAIKSGADLRGANLSGADLSRADLRGADLSRADLSRADLSRADLSGANLSGANLSRADLRGADLSRADLSRADLSRADLSGANLSGANLGVANLSGANLGGAYLGGAYLSGAYLGNQWIIQGATRSDGYAFFLQKLKSDTEPMVKAGCRYFTLAEAQKHWIKTRGGTPLGHETEIIVLAMVNLAHVRGYMKAEVEEAAE